MPPISEPFAAVYVLYALLQAFNTVLVQGNKHLIPQMLLHLWDPAMFSDGHVQCFDSYVLGGEVRSWSRTNIREIMTIMSLNNVISRSLPNVFSSTCLSWTDDGEAGAAG